MKKILILLSILLSISFIINIKLFNYRLLYKVKWNNIQEFQQTTFNHDNVDFLETSRYKVFTRTFGNQNGKKIILLHGLKSSGRTFYPLVKQLSTDYFLIIPDLPAHGETILKNNNSYDFIPTMDDMISVIDILVTTYKIEKLIIIGHSMGGMIALQYAYLFPENIDKLVMMESTPSGNSEEWRTTPSSMNLILGYGGELEKATKVLNQMFHGNVYNNLSQQIIIDFDRVDFFNNSDFPILWLMNIDEKITENFYINLIENTAKKKIYETNITLNTFYKKGHFIHWADPNVGDSIRYFLIN